MADPGRIDRAWFAAQLQRATRLAADFARKLTQQRLPESYAYIVFPNKSSDGHRDDDEVDVYPDDQVPLKDGHTGLLTAAQVVAWCVRNGKVPEWIDISVESGSSAQTLMRLECCGRFNGDRTDLYYVTQGTQPFGIKSPTLPPQHEDGTTFDLYWCARIRI